MTFALKVVKDSQGRTVGFGPNADFYVPSIPLGGTLEYSDEAALYVPPATKDDLVAEVLRTLGKGKDRTVVQLTIAFSETVLIPQMAIDYGVSYEFAKMGAYARNKTYREAVDCETACRVIETAP